MAGEDRRSHLIFRYDGLVLHTRPVTEDEARWLHYHAYYVVKDAALRARYLSEWGNVIDVYDYLERADETDVSDLYFRITGVYEGPGAFDPGGHLGGLVRGPSGRRRVRYGRPAGAEGL